MTRFVVETVFIEIFVIAGDNTDADAGAQILYVENFLPVVLLYQS